MINKLTSLPLVLFSMLWATVSMGQKAGQTVGYIDGLPVTATEVKREMMNARWQQADGNTEAVHQLAVAALVRLKVQEKLLLGENLWPFKTYAALLGELQKTNAARKAKGAVYVGPQTYTEDDFYQYCLNNAVIVLKEKMLENKRIAVSHADLEAQFLEMKKTVYKAEKYTLELYERQVYDACVEKAYAEMIDQLSAEAVKKIDAAKLAKVQL
ncbi:hypothetical protein [Chitinophaga alhagiae]|uniref:hypothetical protein n=1 Tax=Chitinophaga alhagiae TaxID=2203219 RepID=UPI000E5BC367|nr:hypothetical protein [Chitinophaga alhagiae]